ncbi:hypothetical protein [Lentzea aerocolonigenes]|uniref:hypothetical protein n=1 Tax=Lentzea aerocolonigenes TaxID=68170 RepID=UPI001F305281|nr:hypothetical protein [Lentzea aerocolonigenes]
MNTGQADELLRWLHGGTSDDHLLAARLLARHLPAGAPLIDEFLATARGWAMTTQYPADQILASVSRATHHPGLADWLVGLLRDELAPWPTRAEVATALAGRLRDPRAGEAIAFLRSAVDDVSTSVDHRLIAAEALADCGSGERETAERGLRSVLADPLASGWDSRVAAVVLAAFGGEARADAVAALEHIVSDTDTSVDDLCEAATGLAEIGVEFHDRCKEIFLAALRDPRHGLGGRGTAAIGLASLGAQQLAGEAVAALVTDRRIRLNLRTSAVTLLARLGPAQRAKAAELVPMLLGARLEVRRNHPVRLVRLCPQEVGVGLLRGMFDDPGLSWMVVVSAAEALAELGPAFHDEAATQFLRVLNHMAPSRPEFVSCLRGLGNLGEPHRGHAIMRMRAALADLRLTPEARCDAAQALIGSAPEHHAEAAFHLLQIAGSERSPGVVSRTWQQLYRLGPELSARASKELLALVQNDVDGEQVFSVGIFFSSTDVADRCAAAEVLINVLDDVGRSAYVRLQAVQSLCFLGGPFERAAAKGALDLLRSGAIHDLQYLAEMFTSAGCRVRASLVEAFNEILVDELTGPDFAWTAMEALDVLGHQVPAQTLKAYVADPSADLVHRARAAVMLARTDRAHRPEAVALVLLACADVSLDGWRGLVGDLVALGADVRLQLRELADNPDRRREEVAAAACLLGAEGLPTLRRHVQDPYVDVKSRSLAYQMMVETDPSVRAEAIEANLAVLHDPDAPVSERCGAAVALSSLDRTLLPAMSEVLWRFAEGIHFGVAERAQAAEALGKLDGCAGSRLNCVIGALVRHPETTGELAAKLVRRLPREARTEVERVLLADRTVAIARRVPPSGMWHDHPLRAEAEAAVRDVLSSPEFSAAERRQAAEALSRLSIAINPEALALLFADGTPAALALAAREGAWTRVHDQAREVVLDDARPIRERRSAALLIGKISAEPSVRDFLLEDRNAPGRVRVDELRYARAFDELRAVRDSTGVPAAQRRQAVGHLMKLSLDDRAACARVLTEIAADQTVPAALRWRAAGDLTNLGPAGRAEGVRLLEALVHDDRLPGTARSKAAAVVNATVPTKRADMLAVMRGLLPTAKPLQRVGVLLDIGAWWVREAVAELGAMVSDTRWGPVVRLRAADNILTLTRDQRGLCALVAREVATDPSVPGHVRRAAASRLARWSDECREEARALLRDLRCDQAAGHSG